MDSEAIYIGVVGSSSVDKKSLIIMVCIEKWYINGSKWFI